MPGAERPDEIHLGRALRAGGALPAPGACLEARRVEPLRHGCLEIDYFSPNVRRAIRPWRRVRDGSPRRACCGETPLYVVCEDGKLNFGGGFSGVPSSSAPQTAAKGRTRNAPPCAARSKRCRTLRKPVFFSRNARSRFPRPPAAGWPRFGVPGRSLGKSPGLHRFRHGNSRCLMPPTDGGRQDSCAARTFRIRSSFRIHWGLLWSSSLPNSSPFLASALPCLAAALPLSGWFFSRAVGSTAGSTPLPCEWTNGTGERMTGSGS